MAGRALSPLNPGFLLHLINPHQDGTNIEVIYYTLQMPWLQLQLSARQSYVIIELNSYLE